MLTYIFSVSKLIEVNLIGKSSNFARRSSLIRTYSYSEAKGAVFDG